MRERVIELLELFGLPYVLNSMEAERQVNAAMELEEGIVQGVITDDCDAFYLGLGQYTETYFRTASGSKCTKWKTVEKEFDLDRGMHDSNGAALGKRLHFGCEEVSVVNAMEIMKAFPATGVWWTFENGYELSKM